MRGTAKRRGFLLIGAHFGRQRCAWPDGADSRCFPHAYPENRHFFIIRGFPATNVGLGVDGPHNTAGHLQNAPGTPAIRFPLAASGFQSALYVHA